MLKKYSFLICVLGLGLFIEGSHAKDLDLESVKLIEAVQSHRHDYKLLLNGGRDLYRISVLDKADGKEFRLVSGKNPEILLPEQHQDDRVLVLKQVETESGSVWISLGVSENGNPINP